jgi:DNA-binding response OmpR family regulator
LGDLTLDFLSRAVTRGRSAVELTSREYDLLVYLMRHEKKVVTRESLARDVWRRQVDRRRSIMSSMSTWHVCARK